MACVNHAERVITVTEVAADLWHDLPIRHEPEWRRVAADVETVLRTILALWKLGRPRSLEALAGYCHILLASTEHDTEKP